MIIKPRTRGFICTSAHPLGCEETVRRQINYIKKRSPINQKENVLVIGSSTGYGLSSRICAAYMNGSPTIGVCLEKPASKNRTATAGWYNTAAFEKFAAEDHLYAKTIVGDAFSKECKEKTIELIKQDLKKIDLVIYSLAAPRRTMPDGTMYTSVLKTIGEPFTSKGLDLDKKILTTKTIEPASPEEIEATDHVMGGEDWMDWMTALKAADVLSENARTIAYSYIGPELTDPIYNHGTIGHAKEHLYQSSLKITQSGIPAYVSVNKALVTQASAAIPVVPLYISILYRIMKEKGTHEDTIQQISHLWQDDLYASSMTTDDKGRIRLDNLELDPATQQQAAQYYESITDQTLDKYADMQGYQEDFLHLFGFAYDNIDYTKDVEVDIPIPSL